MRSCFPCFVVGFVVLSYKMRSCFPENVVDFVVLSNIFGKCECVVCVLRKSWC